MKAIFSCLALTLALWQCPVALAVPPDARPITCFCLDADALQVDFTKTAPVVDEPCFVAIAPATSSVVVPTSITAFVLDSLAPITDDHLSGRNGLKALLNFKNEFVQPVNRINSGNVYSLSNRFAYMDTRQRIPDLSKYCYVSFRYIPRILLQRPLSGYLC